MNKKEHGNGRVYTNVELKPIIDDLLSKGYTSKIEFLGKGNWGEVYKIRHRHLEADRAVKILLPKYVMDGNVTSRFLGEARKMVKLTHNHIINIFDFGDPEGIPYYIMECVESKDLGVFLSENPDLEREEYREILMQISDALKFIHDNGVVHLDIKAENILISRDINGKGIKLADFGLAHYFEGSRKKYKIAQDINRLPKSFIENQGKELPREFFKPAHDLYYFGIMLEDLDYLKYVKRAFSDRQYKLLEKIIAALKNEEFSLAKELDKKLEKLSPTYPPTGGIPELAAAQAIDSSDTIRIPPQDIVPLTKRLLKLIELPEFQRLRRIKQLGPTSLIYPGASHTRFEHSLGAYSLAVEYLSNLLCDAEFDYLFDSSQLTTLLVAVLLHDIGHYPFSHNLEELKEKHFPSHIDIACDLICGKKILKNRKTGLPLISDILKEDFGISPDSVSRLIKKHNKPPLTKEEQILASFLDGALDVDKQDYLRRDSIHVGVEYAKHIDKARFLRSLTISDKNELAMTEKGKVGVEFLIMSRSAMFSEVYWHHTNRAATAMIQRAFHEFINYKKPKKDAFILELLSKSDEEILGYITKNGPKYIDDLIPSLAKWESRQLYKRVLTFARHYEEYKSDIFDKLTLLDITGRNRIEKLIIRFFNKKPLQMNVEPHEILLDIPMGEEKLAPVQIVYPDQDRYEVSLKEITHFNESIFDQFFKHTKKARVFCHPKHWDKIKDNEHEIRALIASEFKLPTE